MSSTGQKLKKYLVGIVIGILIGIPIGMNIGKGQPVWSNPFADRDLSSQIKDKAQGAISDTKKALRQKLED